MTAARHLLRYLLITLAALLLIAVALVLWLRFEFARLQADPNSYQQLLKIAVQPLVDAEARAQECDQHYGHNKAWFGGLHVHTAASYDATAFGSTVTADDAYAFGRGQELPLRLRGDPPGYLPPVVRISSPLDFMAVTDHAESMGENRLCHDVDSEAWPSLVCRLYRGDLRLPVEEALQPMVRLASTAVFGQQRSRRICGADGERCRQQDALGWRDNQRSTEAWQQPDCSFTTFHAYEYSLAEQASNLHRNVIFKSASVPQAVAGARDAGTPALLWQWLQHVCVNGSSDCDVLAIPHNSNWSSGRMWFPPSATDASLPEQQALATLRAQLEPLAEVMQTKGDSECRNGIASVVGAADEYCDFEKLRPASENIPDCGDQFGSGGMMLQGCVSRYSYVRYALAAGLAEQQKLGVNPFKLGMIAATDTHNGTPAAEMERNYLGSHGNDRERSYRLKSKVDVPGGIASGSPVRYNPGGIAGVYAPENSRQALFEAMQRRETFGTSGPRITPRFFAGWALPENLCETPDMLATAYARGVPMGADLPAANAPTGSPVFLVSAARDPRREGGLLERIQIIKSWIDREGNTRQQVVDVAGDIDSDGRSDASVDPGSCEVSGPGHSQLCAVWRDPDFDAARGAVYYARVLENPSCRWSHYQCLQLASDQRPPSCSDPDLPWSIQERAWTSPIWYQPVPDDALNAGSTVAVGHNSGSSDGV